MFNFYQAFKEVILSVWPPSPPENMVPIMVSTQQHLDQGWEIMKTTETFTRVPR